MELAAKAATESTKQEDDENDDEYESERHHLSPVAAARLWRAPAVVVDLDQPTFLS